MSGLRRAEPGEFTRRAFANGRIDLAEAEGLADLLSAETELQRRSALAMAGGALSRQVDDWRERLLDCSAELEAVLDFSEEDELDAVPPEFAAKLAGARRRNRAPGWRAPAASCCATASRWSSPVRRILEKVLCSMR